MVTQGDELCMCDLARAFLLIETSIMMKSLFKRTKKYIEWCRRCNAVRQHTKSCICILEEDVHGGWVLSSRNCYIN
jgi:hypothetical protein